MPGTDPKAYLCWNRYSQLLNGWSVKSGGIASDGIASFVARVAEQQEKKDDSNNAQLRTMPERNNDQR